MNAPAGSPRRTYRLSPVDHTGWLFGLGLAQLVTIGTSVVVGTVLLFAVATAAGLTVLICGAMAGLVRWRGTSVIELLPQGVRFARQGLRGQAWFAAQPFGVAAPGEEMPPVLADQEVLVVDAGGIGGGGREKAVAVVRDSRTRTYAATLRVAGSPFRLMDAAEQDWLVTQWGVALQGFVSERPAVRQLRWSEWAAPAGVSEHRSWLDNQTADAPVPDAKASYDWLLSSAGPQATRHEVLVTLTVQPERTGPRKGYAKRRDWTREGVELALSEARLFAERLTAAGLIVSGPLEPVEIARAMRVRLDPTCRPALDGRLRSLGQEAGQVDLSNAGPLAARSRWTSWQVDGSWHRGFHVTEWPRLDVPAGWLGGLVMWARSVRSITVCFEPVPRSRSQRSIVRDASKIASDVDHRSERGMRVGAHHRRAARAVEEREEELVSGYGEFAYAGIVVVTAPTIEQLDRASEQIVQAAASVGVELRALHGRHDQATAASLPLARGFAHRTML